MLTYLLIAASMTAPDATNCEALRMEGQEAYLVSQEKVTVVSCSPLTVKRADGTTVKVDAVYPDLEMLPKEAQDPNYDPNNTAWGN